MVLDPALEQKIYRIEETKSLPTAVLANSYYVTATNGTEQNVIGATAVSVKATSIDATWKLARLQYMIDLSNMASATNTVVMRVYQNAIATQATVLLNSVTYSGVQTNKAKWTPIDIYLTDTIGVRMTIQGPTEGVVVPIRFKSVGRKGPA